MGKYIKSLLAVMIFFTACQPGEDEAVFISFNKRYISKSQPLPFGTEYIIDVEIQTSGEGNTIQRMWIWHDQSLEVDSLMQVSATHFRVTGKKDSSYQSRWVFEASDQAGNQDTKEILLSLQQQQMKALDSITLGTIQNTDVPGLFSTRYNVGYDNDLTSNQALNVDIICYYDLQQNAIVITSPDMGLPEEIAGMVDYGNWNSPNATEFYSLAWNDSNLYDLQTDSILLFTYLEKKKTIQKIVRLYANTFYGYKTMRNKFGAFRVDSLVNTDTGFVTISIKSSK